MTKPATTSGSTAGRSGRWWMQSLVSPALLLSVGVALIVTMGVAQRIGWISTGSGDPTTSGDSVARTYTCSMHPQIRQPAPGSCPICGMKLVAATAGEGMVADELAVTLTPAARRLAHIATAVVTRETMLTDIETIGAIAIDESRMVTIPSYIDGRIERLFADYTGVVVAEGDHLAVIYSPELYSAQVEYLESRKAVTGNNPSSIESVRKAQEKLAANSRQKLIELGMQERQITELEQSSEAQSRLTVYASAGGTVIEKSAMEGKYVKAGDPIYRIADLSTVWLMLELYPDDAARIRFGQRVKATMQSLPDETFEGRVAFIDPTVNKQLRTVGVRVEFLNDDARLRPGDYATAKIFLPIGQQGEVYDGDLAGRWISPMHPQIIRDTPGDCPVCGMALVPTSRYGYSDVPVKQPESLNVPRSAVLMAGTHSIVYVESEPGRFEIRPVKLGPILRERIIILDGLKAGDVVATSGNFLIDSQMQLAGKPSLIDPTRAIAAQKERKGPLNFETVQTTTVAGDADRQLDQLYTAYFEIQRSLAGDRKPSEKHAAALHQLAAALADNSDLPESARRLLVVVVDRSQHLHHMKIDAARLDAFRPISHAVVELAASIRSADPTRQFTHFFCPMVKGGGGDWLQNHADLRNPYYGAQMLKCGETVAEYPRDQGSKSANE